MPGASFWRSSVSWELHREEQDHGEAQGAWGTGLGHQEAEVPTGFRTAAVHQPVRVYFTIWTTTGAAVPVWTTWAPALLSAAQCWNEEHLHRKEGGKYLQNL